MILTDTRNTTMGDDIVKLADKANNGFMSSIDDTQENYSISFIQGGMKMSECVGLCETAKAIFLREMNYI